MNVPPADAMAFLSRIFRALGTPSAEADVVAGHLVLASAMGIDSHGLLRVPQYVEMLETGAVRPGAQPQVRSVSPGATVVDYGWNFGQVACEDATDRAMALAAESGVATAVAVHCTHAGRLGHYVERAAERGFLAVGYCNSGRHGHWVAPFGGREGRLATNPLAYALPTRTHGIVVSDFSTAAIPEGKIRILQQEGRPAPAGCIVDAQGLPTVDPDAFYGPPRGAIQPFGGAAGYRGFALGLLVEVMGGLLGGQSTIEPSPGNGVSLTVYDPSHFGGRDRFVDLTEEMAGYLKSCPPAADVSEVLLPGEVEQRRRIAAARDGLSIGDTIRQDIVACARKHGVAVPVEWTR